VSHESSDLLRLEQIHSEPLHSQCLTAAIYDNAQTGTALVTFNARGVGQSGGSMGIFGLNTVPGEKDFAAVERFAVDL
jgi:hypothetical protein